MRSNLHRTVIVLAALGAVAVFPRPGLGQGEVARVGSTHVAGRYAHTTGDYLNEGADQLLRAGMRVIKIYMSTPAGEYPFNSDYPPAFSTMVQVAQHPNYVALFNKPFHTYVITTYSRVSSDGHYWRFGVSPVQYAEERQQFYALARHFLTTYNGTGKTFIFQHWEGDWALRGTTNQSPAFDPGPVEIQGMIDWLNARQDGVNLATSEFASSDVKVYSAAEVNLVDLAMQGRTTVTNNVVPFTYCDLYSYSAWDTISFGAQRLRDALNYLASKAPDSAAFGDKNIFLGEYGWPEKFSNSYTVVRNGTNEALAWGCPYVIFWQLYDNECTANPTLNSDCPGYWLIRLDGSIPPIRDYLVSLMDARPTGINLALTATQTVASSTFTPGESPAKAVDGIIAANSKWTSAGSSGPHWLTLDLGRERSVHTFAVRHAGAGGETTNYNTRQFRIQTGPSLSGPWTDQFVVDNANRHNITLRNYFTPSLVRYVRLYITNPGSDNFARIPEFEVWGESGKASFTASPVTGRAPLTVQFSDISTGNVDSWSWDFGDGGGSTAQHPVHTYTRPGLFTVRLTVTDPGGEHVETRTGYIRAISPDFDGDGDVDQEDFGLLQRCFTGDTVLQTDPACFAARLDDDLDVDHHDFDRFFRCMSGANIPMNPDCMD